MANKQFTPEMLCSNPSSHFGKFCQSSGCECPDYELCNSKYGSQSNRKTERTARPKRKKSRSKAISDQKIFLSLGNGLYANRPFIQKLFGGF